MNYGHKKFDQLLFHNHQDTFISFTPFHQYYDWKEIMKKGLHQCLLIMCIIISSALVCNAKIVDQPVPLGDQFLFKANLQQKNNASVLIIIEKELMELIIRERLGKTDFVFEAGNSIQTVFSDAIKSVFREIELSSDISSMNDGIDYVIAIQLSGYNIRLSKVLVGRHVVDLYLEYTVFDSEQNKIFTSAYDGSGIDGILGSQVADAAADTLESAAEHAVKQNSNQNLIFYSELSKILGSQGLSYVDLFNQAYINASVSNKIVNKTIQASVEALGRAWDRVLNRSIAEFLIDLEIYFKIGKLPETLRRQIIKANTSREQGRIISDHDSWIYLLRSNDPDTKLIAANIIFKRYSNYKDVLNKVESVLVSEYLNIPEDKKSYAEAVAWMCYILGNSKNDQYINTLIEVAKNSDHAGVRKAAMKSLKKYYDISEIENAGSPTIASNGDLKKGSVGGLENDPPSDEVVLINLLRSDNAEQSYLAAEILYKEYGCSSSVAAVTNDLLIEGYNQNLEDKYHVAAMAWMCALLGKSEESKYISTLEQISEQAENKKIKKAARSSLKELKKGE
jgi:hypothetical protein